MTANSCIIAYKMPMTWTGWKMVQDGGQAGDQNGPALFPLLPILDRYVTLWGKGWQLDDRGKLSEPFEKTSP